MKIYQCIHKYKDHILAFERRWCIGSHSTFSEILNAIVKDGYASVYRLIPSEPNQIHDVFFTIWNYERLQFAWAKEHSIHVSDLDEIRLAQIEYFQADVVYDFSPFVAPDFALKLRARYKGKIVAWNSFPKSDDPTEEPGYDAFVSNYRPFVERWQKRGNAALELQPGVDPEWVSQAFLDYKDREYDLIHYGQINGYFRKRANLIESVLYQSEQSDFDFRIFGSVGKEYRFQRLVRLASRIGIEIPGMIKWPPRRLRAVVDHPRFGLDLYETIRTSKAVLNSFIDKSVEFHSNMRIFEVIGNGSTLIAPRGGQYPENITEGSDVILFDSINDLNSIMQDIINEPEVAQEHARSAQLRIARNFNKDRQFSSFIDFISKL